MLKKGLQFFQTKFKYIRPSSLFTYGHKFLILDFTHNVQLVDYFDELLSQNDVGKQDFFSFFFSNVATAALLLTSLLMIWKF